MEEYCYKVPFDRILRGEQMTAKIFFHFYGVRTQRVGCSASFQRDLLSNFALNQKIKSTGKTVFTIKIPRVGEIQNPNRDKRRFAPGYLLASSFFISTVMLLCITMRVSYDHKSAGILCIRFQSMCRRQKWQEKSNINKIQTP